MLSLYSIVANTKAFLGRRSTSCRITTMGVVLVQLASANVLNWYPALSRVLQRFWYVFIVKSMRVGK